MNNRSNPTQMTATIETGLDNAKVRNRKQFKRLEAEESNP